METEAVNFFATPAGQNTLWAIGGVVIFGLLVYLTFYILNKVSPKAKYKLRRFITQNEKDCFHHLQNLFPEYHICPQVCMGALLEPIEANDRSKYATLRNKIQAKVVDFVFIDKDLNPVFIVELDDRSHDYKQEQDKERDLHLSLAGIKTARFRRVNGKFPTRKEIEALLK